MAHTGEGGKGKLVVKFLRTSKKQTLKNSFSKVYVSLVDRGDMCRNGAPAHSFHLPEASGAGASLRPGWPDNRGGWGRRNISSWILSWQAHHLLPCPVRNYIIAGTIRKTPEKVFPPSTQTTFCVAQFNRTSRTQGLGLHVDIKRRLIRPISIGNPPVLSSWVRKFRT